MMAPSASQSGRDPLVTVILTVFKRTHYLAGALRSVQAQTYPFWECIVTDDGNTDEVRKVFAAFAADPRMLYRANQTRLGAPMNVAAAMREARGEFVTILNDDDAMEDCMLATLIRPLLDHPAVVLSFADHWIIDANDVLLEKASLDNSMGWGRATLQPGLLRKPFPVTLRGAVPFVMGTLFRKDAYRETWLVPEVAGAYDHWLALRFARSGGFFFFTSDRVFRYRVHDASETTRLAPEKAAAEVFVFSYLLKEQQISEEDREIIESNLGDFSFRLGRDRLYFGRVSAARSAFFDAVRFRPSLKPLVGIGLTWLPAGLHRALLGLWRFARGIRQPLPPPNRPHD
jgi:glycosyltransferase involved in cell wall biosynthesis